MKEKNHRGGFLSALMLLLSGVLFSIACGEENLITTTGENAIQLLSGPQHTLSFTFDGQIEIDGKPIEKMSDPEIKVAIREFVDAYKKQVENDGLVNYYNRQTGYLLDELTKCKGER